MDTERDIAQEVSGYLLARPLSPDEFAAHHAGDLEEVQRGLGGAADEELPEDAGARGVSQTASGIAGWIWRTVEPVVKQEICAKERYDKLNGIPIEQIAGQVDEILTPLVAAVTAKLPAALKFLAPILGVLRKLIANIIATELRQAALNRWAAYCGLPANG
jgi:hypothetical protein